MNALWLPPRLGSPAAVAKLFDLGPATVVRWVDRQRTSGAFAPKPMGGARHAVLLAERDWLLARIAAVPDATVRGLCEQIGERVHTFLDRPIEGDWPYVWLDATYVKARREHHIVSVAIIVAVGVNTDGRREVLGMTVGQSEAELRCTSNPITVMALSCSVQEQMGQHDTYGSALAAHPGWLQGWPTTNANSHSSL